MKPYNIVRGLIVSLLIIAAEGLRHSDSSDWRSEEGKTCDWVAENPTERCEAKSKDKTKANSKCQVSCNTRSCTDSTSWRHKKGRKLKGCKWIAKNSKRCKLKGTDGSRAKTSCPLACGTCKPDTNPPTQPPQASPTISPQTSGPTPRSCTDSTSWRHKKGRKLKGCKWIAKNSKRCKLKGTDGSKAKTSCPLACGTCKPDTNPPTQPPQASPTISPQTSGPTPSPQTSGPTLCVDRDCQFVADNDLCNVYGEICPDTCRFGNCGDGGGSGRGKDGGNGGREGGNGGGNGGDKNGGGSNIFRLIGVR